MARQADILDVHSVHNNTVRQMDMNQLRVRMPKRMEKAARFRFEQDRLLCIGAGILLREAAGVQDENLLCYGKYGKPYIPMFPGFNLSHSGDWAVLVTGTDPVGVDIEQMEERHLDVASYVFTIEERRWMEADPLRRFHILWTWKESLMKASGMGMTLEPASFSVLPFAHQFPVQLLNQTWYGYTGEVDGYSYSVCTGTPLQAIRWTEWCLDETGVLKPKQTCEV